MRMNPAAIIGIQNSKHGMKPPGQKSSLTPQENHSNTVSTVRSLARRFCAIIDSDVDRKFFQEPPCESASQSSVSGEDHMHPKANRPTHERAYRSLAADQTPLVTV